MGFFDADRLFEPKFGAVENTEFFSRLDLPARRVLDRICFVVPDVVEVRNRGVIEQRPYDIVKTQAILKRGVMVAVLDINQSNKT